MNFLILFHQIHRQTLNLHSYQEMICSERLEQLQRKQPMDQIRSLSGDLLVRKAMEAWGITAIGPLQYHRTEYGKPYLPDYSGFHFNVSHSGNWVLCAAASLPVGIDIQQERPVKDALLRYTLSDQELKYVQTLPNEQKQTAFFDFWCLKEAYCKATGQGLLTPMRTVEICVPELKLLRDSRELRLLTPVEEDYHVGICCPGPLPEHIPTHLVTELL